MAVASGGLRAVILRQLERIGLLGHFDTIVTAEDTTLHKPHPDVFLEAARRLNVPPEQCCVYEDADLGIRMTQKGYRVGVIDATTFEEANVSQSNWVRQRSRWIKGYMQTFLVHTRRPLHLVRSIGPLGTLGFVFFIGGTMLSGLLNPIFWAIFAAWAITQTSGFDSLFPPALLYLNLFNLVLGNGMFIYLMMLAPFRRRWLRLAPFSLTVIWYWVLMSTAAWKGFVQLITKPFYWEKTHHGLSKHTADEVPQAMQPQTAAA